MTISPAGSSILALFDMANLGIDELLDLGLHQSLKKVSR